MSEMESWTRQLLSVIVSQLCKTIGWHSISTTCLQVLVDVLHRYLIKIGTNIHGYTDHFNHTFPALEELSLALADMGVSIEDLKEYVEYVAPIPIKMKVPRYPLEKKSNMNFLKPGSREVVTRPVHIHEHLPAMHPELSEVNYPNNEATRKEMATLPCLADSPNTPSTFKKPGENGEVVVNKRIANVLSQEVLRPVRELNSVMMTTSGFLSPAIEGKVPEARVPKVVHNVPIVENIVSQPTTALTPPETKSEHKKSSHSKSNSKNSERKNRTDEIPSNVKDDATDDSKTKKSSHVKEVSKLKVLKPVANTLVESSSDTLPIIRQEKLKIPQTTPQKEPKMPKPSKAERKLEKIQEQQKQLQQHQHQQQQQLAVVSEKLTTEPNKQKLNIIRRISKVKEDRAESPVPATKSVDDKNASINESIENVVKGFGEKEIIEQVREKENPSTFLPEPVVVAKPIILPGKKIKKKKKKIRDGEPTAKKMKFNNEAISNELERPKPVILEQPPPYPFFTQLPDSLETNYLIPRFSNPFMSMTKLVPNCPHPEMPNLPLPPPMMPTFVDNLQKPPIVNTENDKKSIDPHTLNISDKKLKKKLKKDKREKDKKKRDKKDKVKKEKLGEKKQDKLLKKGKNKEKLKKKDRLNVLQKEEIPEDPSVPKIKLRIGGTNSPLPSPSGIQSPKINVSIVKQEDVPRHIEPAVREPSPELARMPALVGKPVKIKNQPKITIESVSPVLKPMVEPITLSTKGKKASVVNMEIKPKNKEKPTKSSKKAESSKLKPEPFYYDAEGNQVWVCPTCRGPDDGSPMIGCDGCDAWYHWVCVGIKSAPESAKWFCGLCVNS